MIGEIATLKVEADVADGAVLVIEDGRRLSRLVGYVCDYLGVTMRRVSTETDLAPLLRRHRPVAVVCALDARGQDGCHVMKLVAAYDRSLPMLLVAGADPALIGAADAVEEACALTSVRKLQDEPGMGDVVEFLLSSRPFVPAAADIAAFGSAPAVLAAA